MSSFPRKIEDLDQRQLDKLHRELDSFFATFHDVDKRSRETDASFASSLGTMLGSANVLEIMLT